MSYTVIQDVSVKEDKKHYSVFFSVKYLSFFNEKLFFFVGRINSFRDCIHVLAHPYRSSVYE